MFFLLFFCVDFLGTQASMFLMEVVAAPLYPAATRLITQEQPFVSLPLDMDMSPL